MIDRDGPGPLPPFSVSCYKTSNGFTTAVRSKPISRQNGDDDCHDNHYFSRHDNEEMTKVDGFQEPGSFRQVIVIVNPFFFLSCHLIHLPFPHSKLNVFSLSNAAKNTPRTSKLFLAWPVRNVATMFMVVIIDIGNPY